MNINTKICKNGNVELRVEKFGTFTGGQVLVTIGRFRNFEHAIRKHKDIIRDFKRGFLQAYDPPEWAKKFMEEWKKNDIIVTYGQNGTTQWGIEELEELIKHIKIALQEFKPKCSDALNCTYNQINPCAKEMRDKFSNCPFKEWDK